MDEQERMRSLTMEEERGVSRGGDELARGGDGAMRGGDVMMRGGDAEQEAARRFTQADIDRIVQRTIRAERQRTDRLVQEVRAEVDMEAEAREAALGEREQAIDRRERRAEALERLGEKGLPHELADALDYSSAERMKASMDGVEAAFRGAVQRSVDERLRGVSAPGRSAASVDLSRLSDEEYYRTILERRKKG